ncbi:Hexose carrier protein HEX6, partial [Linum perenne]
ITSNSSPKPISSSSTSFLLHRTYPTSFASFFASPITKSYGRKPSILLGGAAFLAGAALGGSATNIYMLIIGRVLLGIGVGFTNQAVPLYLSEMAPASLRVLAANLINFGTEKIKAGYGWRISLGMAAVPAAILTVGALFLPETPSSVIQRTNNKEKAKKILEKIRGTSEIESELEDLTLASQISNSNSNPFRTILKIKYRPQLTMAVAIPFFQQVTGINVIAFYAPLLFRTIGLGESASLMSAVITGAIGILTTFLSMLIVDKIGRRKLFFIGGIQMFISQILVGGIMAAELGDHGGIGKKYAVVVIVLIINYVAGFGLSWGPLGWLVPSEIFPMEIRSAGQSVVE